MPCNHSRLDPMVKELDIEKLKNDFRKDAVIFIPQLIDSKECQAAIQFIENNEQLICDKYAQDTRGLATEDINGVKLIKYFEHPLQEDNKLFGKFLNSRVYDLARILLDDEVYFISGEIHSRMELGTEIPRHQDNAYYGLENGSALTFYIALNEQEPSKGGLKYVSNNVNKEYNHRPSKSKAFSLEIDNVDFSSSNEILYSYSPGDASIHHSRSVHFANKAPEGVKRSFVFRITLHGRCDRQRKGHDEWYKGVIEMNRRANQDARL